MSKMKTESTILVMIAQLLFIALFPGLSYGYSSYQNRIPNGHNVYSSSGVYYPGVGHTRASGGGSLNNFGRDFQSAGHSWTQALCKKDSDGDGLSNGEELGDPSCIWSKGDTPTYVTGITNPGVYDVVVKSTNAPTQKPTHFPTFSPTFYPTSSPSCGKSVGSRDVNLTMPSYSIMQEKTSQVSYLFDGLPEDKIYITRISPVIDQIHMVETMRLLVCENSTTLQLAFSSPAQGTVSALNCTNFVYSWAAGGETLCMPSESGIVINGQDKVYILEVQYFNSALESNYTDSSGFEITYIPQNQTSSNFQPATWGLFGASTDSILIPPDEPFYEIAASRSLPSSFPSRGVTVLATFAFARSMSTGIWATVSPANSYESPYLAFCDAQFDYNLQQVNWLSSNITLYADDRLTVHCTYDSSGRKNSTTGGDEQLEEMCAFWFLYTPANNTTSSLLDANVTASNTTLQFAYEGNLTCERIHTNSPTSRASPSGGSPTSSTSDIPSSAYDSSSFESWIQGAPWQLATHAIMMFVAWVFLFPGATLLPLLLRFKNSTMWFKGHKFLVLIACILSVVAFAIIVKYKWGSNFNSVHGKLGLAIFVIVAVHIALAIVRPGHDDDWRKAWEWAHHALGRALLILGLVNVVLGIKQYELYYMPNAASSKVILASIVIVAAMLIVTVIFVVRRCLAAQKEHTADQTHNPDVEASTNKFNSAPSAKNSF